MSTTEHTTVCFNTEACKSAAICLSQGHRSFKLCLITSQISSPCERGRGVSFKVMSCLCVHSMHSPFVLGGDSTQGCNHNQEVCHTTRMLSSSLCISMLQHQEPQGKVCANTFVELILQDTSNTGGIISTCDDFSLLGQT